MQHNAPLEVSMLQYLCLRLLLFQVSRQVKAGRVHATSSAGHVSADVGQVALCCRFHLAELATERHHRAPQRQQATVLSTEVLVKRLFTYTRIIHSYTGEYIGNRLLTFILIYIFVTITVYNIPIQTIP